MRDSDPIVMFEGNYICSSAGLEWLVEEVEQDDPELTECMKDTAKLLIQLAKLLEYNDLPLLISNCEREVNEDDDQDTIDEIPY